LNKSEENGDSYKDIQEDLDQMEELADTIRNKLIDSGKLSKDKSNETINILPFLLGRSKINNIERARTWLGLLVTGIGIVLFWRGIWDISYAFFSNEVSLLMGASILIVMAIIGKRRVFKIFGGA